jgi:hypothetical protein
MAKRMREEPRRISGKMIAESYLTFQDTLRRRKDVLPLDPEGVRTSSQLNDERGEASSPETATSICLGITVRMRARILADLRQAIAPQE